MKEILLNSKDINGNNFKTIVDDNIYDLIVKNKYTIKYSNGYSKLNYKEEKKWITIPLHHFVFGDSVLKFKPKKEFVIDHINRNKLDNRKENLREITNTQNGQNKEPKNTYNGVSWSKIHKKWISRYSQKNLGYFDTEEEAARNYDEYLIIYPEYGYKLNFEYTEKEKQIIKDNYIHKEKRQLPDNITKRENNTYKIKIQNKEFNINYNKTFKTLEEAIENRNKKLDEIKQLKKEKIYNLPITYNEEGIAYIEVKNKYRTEKCLVDDDKWHELILLSSWSLHSNNSIYGTINSEKIYLHRYLYQKYQNNKEKIPDDMVIDHIKGKCEKTKKLDNRLCNLRMINREQNSFNKINKNPSGYRGVYKDGKKFRAKLIFKGELIFSKGVSTVEEAGQEWNNIVLKTYGEKYGIEFIQYNLNLI
jgi:hypothetical protein